MTRTEQELSPSAHILIKEVDPDDPEEFVHRIECQVEGECGSWWECNEPHVADGSTADGLGCGPYDVGPDEPWFNRPEFEFHGVMHTWVHEHGWTVPWSGCAVAVTDWEWPREVEALPPGRYRVDDEWIDDCVYLVYRGPEVTR